MEFYKGRVGKLPFVTTHRDFTFSLRVVTFIYCCHIILHEMSPWYIEMSESYIETSHSYIEWLHSFIEWSYSYIEWSHSYTAVILLSHIEMSPWYIVMSESYIETSHSYTDWSHSHGELSLLYTAVIKSILHMYCCRTRQSHPRTRIIRQKQGSAEFLTKLFRSKGGISLSHNNTS